MSRKERDHLGELELPDDAYYGIQTLRAYQNFPVSGLRGPPELVRAYVMLKKAAAMANMGLGELDVTKGGAIVEAADQVLSGEHTDAFIVDVYQAGAGTSFNMNVNEVLANLALESLGRPKGDYQYLSPNDHVNMAQSTNDTYPTAAHMAIIDHSDRLSLVLVELAEALRSKSEEFRSVHKSGRTHLMDAVPVTLGQEFGAYAAAIGRAENRIKQRQHDLLELPIGGTATGTGANGHPRYREAVIAALSELCGREFRPAHDSFEALQSRAQMMAYSSALKELAVELIRIANDLRLLGSGPTTGLAEIEMPAVQPGSSIMPGKVNPVLAECLDMICFQVVGNDTAVMLAGQAGQMELNVMAPLMAHNVLTSQSLLINFLPVFVQKCVKGMRADEGRCRSYVERNPILATLLSKKIGYLKAADLADESMRTGRPIPELAVEKGLLTSEEARELFDPRAMTAVRFKKGHQ
jgi:aspartate ammonia-lyase